MSNMKAQKSERLDVRVERDVIGWLRRAAAKKRTTVSELTRQIIYEQYDQRHAK